MVSLWYEIKNYQNVQLTSGVKFVCRLMGRDVETICPIAFVVYGKMRRLKAKFFVFVVFFPAFNICFN
jgi:hypothetical protein